MGRFATKTLEINGAFKGPSHLRKTWRLKSHKNKEYILLFSP